MRCLKNNIWFHLIWFEATFPIMPSAGPSSLLGLLFFVQKVVITGCNYEYVCSTLTGSAIGLPSWGCVLAPWDRSLHSLSTEGVVMTHYKAPVHPLLISLWTQQEEAMKQCPRWNAPWAPLVERDPLPHSLEHSAHTRPRVWRNSSLSSQWGGGKKPADEWPWTWRQRWLP